MNRLDGRSRMDKFEKRRKNSKSISIFLVIGSILIVLLIALMVFGGRDDKADEETPGDERSQLQSESDRDLETETHDEETEDGQADTDTPGQENDENGESETPEEAQNDGEKEQLESEDDIVIESFTDNWAPIGTEQTGPHTVVYEAGSQDRIEMEQAIRVATGLSETDMVTWWLERNGDQKVRATVSNKNQDETYRVYLSWIDKEGWQPTQVDVLKENDQKWRFEE
ncbi:YrrS family protein [Lentibacillus saliphilus]|uniref:YrrS family protein n=1 Tax=Lentibacillus saliphilus TaxID=2737028 RepID=UPI001C2FE43B|nr:YrrS family protein [Lentibacillus saliphilus]